MSRRGDGSLAPRLPPGPMGSFLAVPLYPCPHHSQQAVRWEARVLGSASLGMDARKDRVSEGGLGTAMLVLQWEHLHQPQKMLIAPRVGSRSWAHGLVAVAQLEAACPLPVHLGDPVSLGTARLVPTEMEPSMQVAGRLVCISLYGVSVRATGITPGPTTMGLCWHPAGAIGSGAKDSTAEPSLG